MSSSPGRLDSVIHLGSCGALSTLGKSNAIVPLEDSLFVGPCDANPETHGDKRREFWLEVFDQIPDYAKSKHRKNRKLLESALYERVYSVASLGSALGSMDESLPIVLWTSREWSERLRLWWTLDAVRCLSIDASRVWIAESRTPDCDISKTEDDEVAAHGIELMRQAFDRAEKIGERKLSDGADLWRSFASHSPRDFDQARKSGAQSFEELPIISVGYRYYVPRSDGHRMALSEFDQTIFDQIGASSWVRPYDVFIYTLHHPVPTMSWCLPRMVNLRIRQWHSHRHDNPVFESRPIDGANSLTTTEYRLTEIGRQIRDAGLDTADEAPSMFLGGCEYYAGQSPWVIKGNQDDWSIQRLVKPY